MEKILCSKQRFTKNEARIALKASVHCRKKYRREIRSYYCFPCNAWHLSSKEKQETLNIEINYINKWKKILNGENRD